MFIVSQSVAKGAPQKEGRGTGRRYHLKRDDLAEGGRRGRGSADLPGLRSRRRRKEVNSMREKWPIW